MKEAISKTLLASNKKLFLKQRIRKLVLERAKTPERGFKTYAEIARELGEERTYIAQICKEMPFFKGIISKGGAFYKILCLGTFPASALELTLESENEIVRATVASLLLAHGLEVFSHGNLVHVRVETGAGKLLSSWIRLLLPPRGSAINTMADDNGVIIYCSTDEAAELLANELVGYVPDEASLYKE